jgi:hypothetical protein
VHNRAVTNGQAGAACPQCGSTAAVHSIEELAALARSRLGEQPGSAAAGQPGYAAEPRSGPPGPPPGYAAEPRSGPPGPPPGYAAEPRPGPPGPPGPVPGYAAEPRSGPPGRWPGRGSRLPDNPIGDGLSLEDDIAGVALNAAARFIGRAISRRVQRTVSEQVLPTLAARQEATLRAQIEIAGRHPDLRACLTDQVVFLAGGSRALPMPPLTALTVEQADALVARLRDG